MTIALLHRITLAALPFLYFLYPALAVCSPVVPFNFIMQPLTLLFVLHLVIFGLVDSLFFKAYSIYDTPQVRRFSKLTMYTCGISFFLSEKTFILLIEQKSLSWGISLFITLGVPFIFLIRASRKFSAKPSPQALRLTLLIWLWTSPLFSSLLLLLGVLTDTFSVWAMPGDGSSCSRNPEGCAMVPYVLIGGTLFLGCVARYLESQLPLLPPQKYKTASPSGLAALVSSYRL